MPETSISRLKLRTEKPNECVTCSIFKSSGPFVRLFSPRLQFIQHWVRKEELPVKSVASVDSETPIVITISREYGSGGHLISQRIEQDLCIKLKVVATKKE